MGASAIVLWLLPPNSSPLRIRAFTEPQELTPTQIETLRMMGRPCRHPEPRPGPATVCASRCLGLGFPLCHAKRSPWMISRAPSGSVVLGMNQLPKLVSSVWVTETVATELSPLTLAFLDGLAGCCVAPGPRLGLGSQKTPRKVVQSLLTQTGTPSTQPGAREQGAQGGHRG